MAVSKAALALLIALSLVLGACGKKKSSKIRVQYDPNVARYRLLLRENPVDPGEAFRCYGGCQEQTSPSEYLTCLADYRSATRAQG